MPRWRRLRSIILRWTLLVATVGAIVASPMKVALACSCGIGDLRDALAEADAAFVGDLVRKDDEPTGPVVSSGEEITWTFRVEVGVKGDLGPEVDVRSPWSGGSCGFEVPFDERVGVLLYDEGGEWQGGLCTQVGPDELLAAAGPLPEPQGAGPVTFLVGGSFGEMRLLALDALGRTLAYGAGRGDTVALGLCPGSQFAVEAVHDGEEGFLAVRDLRTFEVVRELVVGRGGSPRLHAVACLDREGRRTLAIDGSDEDTSRIWVANADRTELVFEGRVWEARLQGGRALVVLPDGDLLAFDADARRTNLGHLPPRMSHVTLSPDGSMAAGILYGGSLSGEPPTEVVLVGLPEGPVLRSSLEGWNDSGHVAWLDDQRLVYLPGGADDDRARVFDIAMREIAGFDDWYTSEATVVGDTVYGIGWGELVAAELPRGPVIVLQRFESPETFAFAYVSGGPKVGNFASPARAEHEGLAAPGPSDMDERADSSRWMPVWLLPAGGLVLAAVLLRRRPRRQR